MCHPSTALRISTTDANGSDTTTSRRSPIRMGRYGSATPVRLLSMTRSVTMSGTRTMPDEHAIYVTSRHPVSVVRSSEGPTPVFPEGTPEEDEALRRGLLAASREPSTCTHRPDPKTERYRRRSTDF